MSEGALQTAMPRRWLWVGLCETVFWAPLFLIPMVARVEVGEHVWRIDVQTCLFMTAVFAVIGGYFGRFQPLYRLVLYIVFALGSLIVTGMVLAKQGALDPFVMLAIIDTNRSESAEFTGGRYGSADVALACGLVVPLAAYAVQLKFGLFLPRLRYAGTALVALFAAQMGVRFVHEVRLAAHNNEPRSTALALFGDDIVEYPVKYAPLQPYVALASALKMRREIAGLAATATPLRTVGAIPPVPARRVFVVVVGESLTRRHMHLYGYPRDTTPKLDRLAENGELLAFRHIVTPHAMTVPALSEIFQFHAGAGHDGHTLFDVLNGAGFTTYWISNQYQYGLYESGVSLLTSAAHQQWLNQPLEQGYQARRNFDDDVLPPLHRVLGEDGPSTFVFLHLLGSHYYYPARYPPAEEHFVATQATDCRSPKQQQAVDEYDSSVRFNDGVVSQIIDAVRAAGTVSFVLYFSDHGEEVYEFRDFAGHGDGMISPYTAEVPLVLWLSPEYRSAYPDFAAPQASFQQRRASTADLLYGISDLARLTFPGMDPTRSLFSPEFVARPRITAGQDYDRFAAAWKPDAAHASPAEPIVCDEDATVKHAALAAPAR
jgi:heptose-I-phosphate ethanolaminephosphotransferase